MQKLDFGEKLDLIVQQDPRYDREAYLFLRDALDYTIKLRKKAKEGRPSTSPASNCSKASASTR